MSRTNFKTRASDYAELVERQKGEYCILCKISPITLLQLGKDPTLVIDHINGDITDTNLKNKRLLCKSCNRNERHSLPDFLESDNQLYEISKNYESKGRIYVANRLNEEKAIEKKGIIADIAAYIPASMQYARNLLTKLTAPKEGIYRWEDRGGVTYLAYRPELKF